MNSIKALLLIAGKGERFSSAIPKQFHSIGNKKVYLYPLETLLQSAIFTEILLICSTEWTEEVKKDIAPLKGAIRLVEGGATRQESVYNGLVACGEDTDAVLIHDGARPLLFSHIVKEHISALAHHRAINTCIPSSDTLVHAPDQETIMRIPKREEFLRGQTPQSFSYPLLLQAHQIALRDGMRASDDCALVLALNEPVYIVKGDDYNIKITSPLDLLLAETLLTHVML